MGLKDYLIDIVSATGIIDNEDPIDIIGFDYQKYSENKRWRAERLSWPEMVWYKLGGPDGRMAIPCKTLLEWTEWYTAAAKDDGEVVIAFTLIGTGGKPLTVKTTFLGLDTEFGGGKPRMFETRIWGYHEYYRRRRTVWSEALRAHAAACEVAKRSVQAAA